MNKKFLAGINGIACLASWNVQADEAGDFIVRAGAASVNPSKG